MTKCFLIVFHGQIIEEKIIDIGDDPCFDSPPSWGICRPPTRRAVNRGDTLIFIAKVDNNYFLKGWFQVGEKLDYITALKRFPSRQNVIISATASTKAIKWRYKSLETIYAKSHGQTTPNFLLDLKSANGIFYQNQVDEHEIDNWKCRRVFHCGSKQFESCITNNTCLKNGTSLTEEDYKNYVVADHNRWADLDNLRITFDEIVKETNFPTPICTPKGQHNVLRFDEYMDKLFALINNKKALVDSTNR